MITALRVLPTGASGGRAAMVDVELGRPGPGQLAIDVHAVSASHLDLSSLRGGFPGSPLPRTIGTDPVGVVTAVGDGVDPGRVGERVAVKPNVFCGECEACRRGEEADCEHQQILGVHRDGGAAQAAVVPARCAFPVPETTSDVEACALVHTAPVALHMLRIARDDYAGRSVLVTGAAGGVGSAAVQLIRVLGGTPIAAVRGGRAVDAMRGLGAEHVLDTAEATLTDLVRRVAPDGVDVAVDATGVDDVASEAITCLAWRGAFVTCAGSGTLTVEQGSLYRRRRRILGSAGSDVRDVRDALRLAGEGRVTPLVAMRLPLAEYERGYGALTDRSRAGKVVFEVSRR